MYMFIVNTLLNIKKYLLVGVMFGIENLTDMIKCVCEKSPQR